MGLVRKLWVLMVTVFVDMIGFLIVHPLLPFYAERHGAGPLIFGLLVATFPIGQLLTAPLWGRLSDRYGRKPILVSGLALSAISFLLFAFSDSLILLFAFRLLQGAGGGTTGVVMAYVSDAVERERRAEGLGWTSAAASLGVTIGPAIGSFAIRWGVAAPGLVAAGLCVLNIIFAWRWLPQPKAAESESASPDATPETAGEPAAETGENRKRTSILATLGQVVFRPGDPVHRLMWIYALGMMAFMALNGILPLFLKDRFGATEHNIGWYFTYVGALSVLMRAVLLGPIVKRFGEIRTMRIGAISIGFGLAVIPLAWNLPSLAIAAMFIPIGTALLFPSTTSQVSARAKAGETGETLGVQQTFGGLSRVVGPIWAGAVYGSIGTSMPFWMGAGLMGVVFLIGLGVRPLGRPEPKAVEVSAPSAERL